MIFADRISDTTFRNSKDAMAYNPVLFVKDFGAAGEYTTDYTFMTNADTPYLAMQGLIDDAVNPFTGRPIYRPEEKNAPKQYILYADSWSLPKEATTIDPGSKLLWYSLENQDIFNKDNWGQEESEPKG